MGKGNEFEAVSQEMALGAKLLQTLNPPTELKTLGEVAAALKLDPEAIAAAWCACLASGAEHGFCNRRDFAIGVAIYARLTAEAKPKTANAA